VGDVLKAWTPRIGVFAAAVVGALVLGRVMVEIDPTLIVGALFVIPVSLGILARPWVGVLVLVIILPFNGLISRLLGDSTIATVYGIGKDYILLLLVVAALMAKGLRRVPAGILILVVLIVVSGAVSGVLTPDISQALYGWRNDFEPLLLIVAVAAIMSAKTSRIVTTAAVVMAQVSAAIGIYTWNLGLQWLFDIGRLPVQEGETFPTSFFSAGSVEPRAFSPYTAPNEMAAATAVMVAIIWSRGDWSRARRVLLSILPVVVIWLSGSRSGMIGVGLLFGVIIARAMLRRWAPAGLAFITIGGIGGFIFATLFLSAEADDPSLGGHADSFVEALPTILANPFGLGVGQVGPRAAQFDGSLHVESFWLLLALESGIIALVAFLALLGVLFAYGARAGTPQAFLASTAIAATLVSQIVLPALQEGPVSYSLWIAVGLGLAAALRAREEAAEQPEEALVDAGPLPEEPATTRSHDRWTPR
jgi:putative inorganic carbon (HCO3(-)) transporter